MEYFKGNADLNPITSDEDGADAFAEAIRRRFSAPAILASPFTMAPPTSVVAARARKSEPALLRITPPLVSGITSQTNKLSPQLGTKLPSIPASFFTSTTPASLPALISDHATLLVDIRPPSQYDAERISSSVPLSVPSTLLKRPLFTLEKLATMLPSKAATEQFLKWSVSNRIIIVDTESSKLPEMSNVLGLLRKFRAERFAGELCWVQGGFAAISREAKCNRELAKFISSKPVATSCGVRSGNLARNLPHAAFEQSSTTIAGHRPTLSPSHSRKSSQSENLTPRTHGAALGPSSRRVLAANPFYDNIRQLSELSQGITERIPLQIPQTVQDRSTQLPFKWLRDLAGQTESESAESLAMQFYKVELAEQRRLMGIMDEHSRQSNDPTSEGDQHFPFSITAGIEEGEKNRYRNIWPYEHSRVQLQKSEIASSDYINASYVQPPGTDKRYIATQGPLPESYADFWMMVWDQNVPAIVMLTKRFEGSSVKCGTYWPVEQQCGQTFGDIVVTLVSLPQEASEDDAIPPSHAESGGFNFGQTTSHESLNCEEKLARRSFIISNLREPQAPPREVSHFQYLDWPDHDVPASPQGLLDLIGDVDIITSAAQAGPAVLHCSAGVGRTGAYILVDAVLDAVKKELRSPGAELLQPTDAGNSSQESSQEMDMSSSADDSPRSRTPSESAADAGESSSKPGCSPEVQLHGRIRHDSKSPCTVSNSSLPRSTSAEEVSEARLPHMQEVSRRLRTTSDSRPKVVRKRVTALKKGRSIASLASPMVPMDWETTSPPASRCESVASSMPAPIQQLQPNTAVHPTGIHSDSSLSLSSSDASPFSKKGSSSMTPATSLAPSRKNSPPSPTANAFDFMQPRSTAVQTTQSHLMSLSMIDEPIRHVLESMREQRMSLCQTLRQFVFAHQAIIEGSLAMVDDPQTRVQAYPDDSFEQKHAGREGDSSGPGISIKARRSLKRRQRSESVSPPRPVSRLKSDP